MARPRPEVEGETTTKRPKPEITTDEKATRRSFGRGWLAEAIEAIFRKQEAGKLKGVDGPLTVSKIRSLIVNEAGEQPSTGAVSAVLARWTEDGYIKVSGKPVAFTGFVSKYSADKGGNLGDFLEATKERKRKARAAA